jgi:hypothetical protein
VIDWDEINRGINVLAPTVIGIGSDLIQKRKNSMSGLQSQMAKLKKKLDKTTNPYDRANLEAQINQIAQQMENLQAAIDTNAPPNALDTQLEQSKPGASPLPWVLGGLALVGVVGVSIWAITRKGE